MKNKTVRTIGIATGAALLLLAVLLALLNIPKDVTLLADGRSLLVHAWAWNVEQLLALAGVELYPADQVTPPLSTRLENGLTVSVQRARAVLLQQAGQVQTLYTTRSAPADWLADASIDLPAGARLLGDGQEIDPAKPSQARLFEILPPASLLLVESGQEHTYQAVTATLGQALWQAGLRLRLADHLQPGLNTPLTDGMEARLERARALVIHTQQGDYPALSAAATVGQALAENGFALQGLDYSQPADDQPLPADGRIKVVRVQEIFISNQTTLPFESQYQPDPDTEIDQKSVIQAGLVGLEEQRQRVRYEDGVETGRIDEGKVLVRAPKDQIVGYGTKLVMHTIDTPDGPINYWRAIPMLATSYHPAETGGSTTASGLQVKKGIVAVDRRYIPFYTRLYIPGYGEAIAADTGGAVVGRIIDLGYEDSNYVSWYKRVTVYFLWPPPANIVWIYP